jgi:hypothetical protein
MAWWVFVFLVLGVCVLWVGYSSGTRGLGLIESGINGAITWVIPGTVGLTIGGITSFISAFLWGSIQGYEIFAFLGGLVVIVILLATGTVVSFVLAVIGRFFAKSSKS